MTLGLLVLAAVLSHAACIPVEDFVNIKKNTGEGERHALLCDGRFERVRVSPIPERARP